MPPPNPLVRALRITCSTPALLCSSLANPTAQSIMLAGNSVECVAGGAPSRSRRRSALKGNQGVRSRLQCAGCRALKPCRLGHLFQF